MSIGKPQSPENYNTAILDSIVKNILIKDFEEAFLPEGQEYYDAWNKWSNAVKDTQPDQSFTDRMLVLYEAGNIPENIQDIIDWIFEIYSEQ